MPSGNVPAQWRVHYLAPRYRLIRSPPPCLGPFAIELRQRSGNRSNAHTTTRTPPKDPLNLTPNDQHILAPRGSGVRCPYPLEVSLSRHGRPGRSAWRSTEITYSCCSLVISGNSGRLSSRATVRLATGKASSWYPRSAKALVRCMGCG